MARGDGEVKDDIVESIDCFKHCDLCWPNELRPATHEIEVHATEYGVMNLLSICDACSKLSEIEIERRWNTPRNEWNKI